ARHARFIWSGFVTSFAVRRRSRGVFPARRLAAATRRRGTDLFVLQLTTKAEPRTRRGAAHRASGDAAIRAAAAPHNDDAGSDARTAASGAFLSRPDQAPRGADSRRRRGGDDLLAVVEPHRALSDPDQARAATAESNDTRNAAAEIFRTGSAGAKRRTSARN